MAVTKETLNRIKEMVESEKEAELPNEDEQLKAVIERLKKKDAPAALSVAAKKDTLNFEKVNLPKAGILSKIGGIYRSFGNVFTKVAKIFARFPIGQDLEENLASAGMKIEAEAFLIGASVVSLIVALMVFFFCGILAIALTYPALGLAAIPLSGLAFVIAGFGVLSIPKAKAEQRAQLVDRNLPFALRQLSTQVKAGVSFHKAMQSIASSNYGVLSEELLRVVSEVNRGETMETALLKLAHRTRSKGLKRTITQVLRSFKSGGNLSQIISDIADDVSFESRMSIRDFTEKLNFINVIYIMVAVVAPVTLAILSAILQIPLFAGGIPPFLLYFGFLGVLVIMCVILVITKRMEPITW